MLNEFILWLVINWTFFISFDISGIQDFFFTNFMMPDSWNPPYLERITEIPFKHVRTLWNCSVIFVYHFAIWLITAVIIVDYVYSSKELFELIIGDDYPVFWVE
jgi:hypothetical protein